MLKHLCPCFGRHCYLDEPQCERGTEYAKTGVIPPRKPKPGGGHGGKKPSEQKMKYLAMDRESKIAWNLQEIGRTIRMLEEAEQNEALKQELFACLREEDRADLLMLLEKIKHDWRHRFSDNSGEQHHHNTGEK